MFANMEIKTSLNDEQHENFEEKDESKLVLTRERYHPKGLSGDEEHDLDTDARPGAYRIGGDDGENPNRNAPRATVTGLNENPRVCISESERMPGYLKKSHVPPKLSLPSKTKKSALGLYFLR